MMKFINNCVDTVLELIYPRRCIVCGGILPFKTEKWLCNECKGTMQVISGNKCSICGVPIMVNDVCSTCAKHKRHFKKAYIPYEYEDNVKRAIHNIKFKSNPLNLKYFADVIADYAVKNGCEKADFVTFVPMYGSDENKRGFNQSAFLAKYISKKGFGKYFPILKKIRKTQKQHELSHDERLKNLKKAYKVHNLNLIKDKNIILVDDVYTTGATAEECSKTLIAAGAKRVEVMCIAIVNTRK